MYAWDAAPRIPAVYDIDDAVTFNDIEWFPVGNPIEEDPQRNLIHPIYTVIWQKIAEENLQEVRPLLLTCKRFQNLPLKWECVSSLYKTVSFLNKENSSQHTRITREIAAKNENTRTYKTRITKLESDIRNLEDRVRVLTASHGRDDGSGYFNLKRIGTGKSTGSIF
jgi:hypothetical protein